MSKRKEDLGGTCMAQGTQTVSQNEGYTTTFVSCYSQDRIEGVRSRFLNRHIRFGLFGQVFRGDVVRVSDDGEVEVRCETLVPSVAAFSIVTNVNLAYITFVLFEEWAAQQYGQS